MRVHIIIKLAFILVLWDKYLCEQQHVNKWIMHNLIIAPSCGTQHGPGIHYCGLLILYSWLSIKADKMFELKITLLKHGINKFASRQWICENALQYMKCKQAVHMTASNGKHCLVFMTKLIQLTTLFYALADL